jgi:hypothetical protein
MSQYVWNLKHTMVRKPSVQDLQPVSPTHWIKDKKYNNGYPAILLVNKATREALKHSLG